eukprot:7192661-Pyramimonas_sp.AAC.2
MVPRFCTAHLPVYVAHVDGAADSVCLLLRAPAVPHRAPHPPPRPAAGPLGPPSASASAAASSALLAALAGRLRARLLHSCNVNRSVD